MLRAQRASTIGPDLSHRRTLVAQMLKTADVRQRRAPRNAGARLDAPRRAACRAQVRRGNRRELFPGLRALHGGDCWAGCGTGCIDGVEFEHVEKLNEIGDGAEIIYVPCHRSHMDYLLLSYVIYRKGFAVPHVAAGVNLNMPVIGRFLRKGGAFFLRRSFKGDALYAAVFAKYLGFMMARGHPLEYFIEGGRSRTGRLLLAAHRHAVDDACALPARSEAPGGVHAGVFRLRAHRRGANLHRRAVGAAEEKGERARPDQGP